MCLKLLVKLMLIFKGEKKMKNDIDIKIMGNLNSVLTGAC